MAPVTLATLGTQSPAFPDSVIASLSATSTAGLKAKTYADQVKSGTLVGGSTTSQDTNIKNVNNRIGPISLLTAIWWQLTGDATYLAPLKTFILASPKPVDATQALNEFRAIGGMLLAVDLLKRKGQWDDTALLPNHNNIPWSQYVNGDGGTLLPLNTRVLQTTGGRWSRLMVPSTGFTGNANEGTADDSTSNWGSVAIWALMGWAILTGNQSVFDHCVLRVQKRLGETPATLAALTGMPDFTSSGTYIASWNNWLATASGTGVNIPAGLGKRDTAAGLNGVVINDIDRGSTGYSATAAFFGASGSGLTYPLEHADFLWPTIALLIHMGYPAMTWGDDAINRMNDRFAVVGPADTLSLFTNGEAGSGIYKNPRFFATQLSQRTFGTPPAVASSVQSMPRSVPFADWIAPIDGSSLWGQYSLAGAGTTKTATITDSIGLVDSRTQTATWNKSLTDAVGITDTPNTASAGTTNLNITDAIGLTDSRVVQSDVVVNTVITDAIGLLDVINTDLVVPGTQLPPVITAFFSSKRIWDELVADGYTNGSILDRERQRLLDVTGRDPKGLTLQDLYSIAGERPRL